VGAAVSFYGGFKKVPIRWENLSCPILMIYGEIDESVPASEAKPLEDKLKALGKKVETIIFRGAPHGFFNDTRPGIYREECAVDAWQRTVAHFRAHLG
jgi:carboxymethylenebutenolidase